MKKSIYFFFHEHRMAFLVSVAIGLIYVWPHLAFTVSLGDEYRGIPMMQTANEDFYLARVQEVRDGHPSLGSAFFYEYKNEPPLSPPVGEYLYAVPAIFLGVSPVSVLIASRFILPTILFFLAYLLIFRITEGGSEKTRAINAIAGGLLIVLGYDLIDYRNIFAILKGERELFSGGFLIWSRPMHPILGGIFLFSFLLYIWEIIQGTKKPARNILGAGVFLALMIGSYLFSWGMAVSIAGALMVIYFARFLYKKKINASSDLVGGEEAKKDWSIVWKLALTLCAGVLLSLPYWYYAYQASLSPFYETSVVRSGIYYTHTPLYNKLTLIALAGFAAILLVSFLNNRKEFRLKNWHWLCFAFLFGSLWAYNQQIVTGRTIWPYHFVQYSIPLVAVVFMASIYTIVRQWAHALWVAVVFCITAASLLYSISVQTSVYGRYYEEQKERQAYADVFDWLNKQEKDCVVLVIESAREAKEIHGLIPAFTHCNFYSNNWVFSLMPQDRIFHNYLIQLRFKGVNVKSIEAYLQENRTEARSYLFSSWIGLYGNSDFPDFPDMILEERLKTFPNMYREFLSKDLKTELERYKLDYILSLGPLSDALLQELPSEKLEFQKEDLYIYKME